ncbi:ABC transporter permease [Imperialibacter roseus]|uniref:ABC transporter permease n=1 Tax=Imperialibacter roseus TaxID=1324217 RepID=A0ABZ0IVK6_9BACT|nr:ABC transporter permease [Imperialibacter roseus]WOK08405.1 ABC transporter permease [Imperialibacter roseus]
MFRNYLVIAIRNLVRNRIFSLINVSGLAIGIASFLLIGLYSWQVLHYDSFHKDKERIFRIVETADDPSGQEAYVSFGLSKQLKAGGETGWEVLRMASGTYWIGSDDRRFKEKVFFGDPNFFNMLDIPLSKGQREQVLQLKNGVVIGEALAGKLFGNEDPIGKVIKVNVEREFVVTGVMDNASVNTVFDAEAIVPFSNVNELFYDNAENGWHDTGCTVLVKTTQNEGAPDAAKLRSIFLSSAPKEFVDDSKYFYLQPLTDLYVNASGYQFEEYAGDTIKSISYQRVLIFVGVGIFILVIAVINYFNLTTSIFVSRMKEIGIRRVNGASKAQLSVQFMTEATVTTFIGLALGLAIAQLAKIWFGEIMGEPLTLQMPGGGPVFLMAVVVLGGALSLLNGSYPAFYLSSKASALQRGQFKAAPGENRSFRNLLVVFQMTISLGLLTGLVVMTSQLDYLQQADKGFDQEGVLTIAIDMANAETLGSKAPVFAEQVRKNASIESVSLHQASMGRYIKNLFGVFVPGADKEQSILTTYADENYLKTYKIDLLEGSSFDAFSDSLKLKKVLINEAAAKYLGWKVNEAVGQSFRFHWKGGPEYQVAGVVKDFNLRSMHYAIEPSIFLYPTSTWHREYISIRPAGSMTNKVLEEVEKEWEATMGSFPMEYFFTDDEYRKNYVADERQQRGIFVASLIAIFIGCFGLFGLASYTVGQKSKEIGIRKVLGASVSTILLLLSRSYVVLVVVALVVAAPVSFYLVQQWLEGFAYRITLSWWMFLLPGLTVLVVALFSVSIQSLKASLANPVDSLRTE